MIPYDDRETYLLNVLRKLDSTWSYYVEKDTKDTVVYNNRGLEIHAPSLLSAVNAALSLYHKGDN